MNCYLITNPQYEIQLCKYIPHFKNRGSGRRTKAVPVVVKSREEFETQRFKTAFGNRSDDDTVFIVPELGWDDDWSVECGYKVALDIIDDKLKDKKFFNIVFISILSREQLLQVVDPEYKEIVKSFPHLSLLDLLDPKEPGEKWSSPLEIPAYSQIHFDFLKHLVISKSGRLEYIKHQVFHLLDQDYSSLPDRLEDILGVLSLPAYGADAEKLSHFRKQARAIHTDEAAQKFVVELREYIDVIKKDKFSVKDTPVTKYDYKVLIIEDDKVYRENLLAFYQRFFNDVVAYGNEDIVSAKEKVKEDAGKYSIIILDLMYSTNGLDKDVLPFNGLDLYQIIRKEEDRKNAKAMKDGTDAVHRAAVRLVTAVPRNDIKNFTVDSPRVFTKGNGWDQLEFCMVDRMEELIEECKKNEDDFIDGQYAPKTGVFHIPGALELIKANPDKFDAAMKYAQRVSLGLVKMTDYSCASAAVSDPESVLEHLDSILTHRRLVIKYILTKAKKNEFIEDTDDSSKHSLVYRDFICPYLTEIGASAVLDPKGKPTRFGKGYLQTRLGFNISDGKETIRKMSDYREEDRIYTGNIDLQDDKAFFKDEIDSLAQEVFLSWADDVLSGFGTIPYYAKITNSKVSHHYRRLASACKHSGLDVMLKEPDPSPTYLTGLFTRAYDYIREMHRQDGDLKACDSLRNFFAEEIGIDDPTKRRLISIVSPELVEILYKVIDFDSTTGA